jgi:tRNA(Ile2) C34 agmatinyltransferase TiaS
LSRLQVFAELLPRRIAVKEVDDVKAEETLTQATNQFIHEHLGPRVRRLAARTRVIVESELASHYRERAALIVAVAQSQRVQSIERLAWTATVRPERGAIAHAEGALKSWAAVDEFEKTLTVEGI